MPARTIPTTASPPIVLPLAHSLHIPVVVSVGSVGSVPADAKKIAMITKDVVIYPQQILISYL